MPINGYSDGDFDHRPKQAGYYQCDPITYLEKVAKLWVKERGIANPGR